MPAAKNKSAAPSSSSSSPAAKRPGSFCVDHWCIEYQGPPLPDFGFLEFAGMISATIQNYRGNNTAKKLVSRIGVA